MVETDRDPVFDEYLEKGKNTLKEKGYREAEEYYEKAVMRCDELLKSNPRNSLLYYRKAFVLYELRRFEEPDSLYVKRCKDALIEIDRAIELNPEVNYYHYLRNEILGEFTYRPDWSLKWGWYGELEIDANLMFFGPSPNYVKGFAVDADGAPLEICSDMELSDVEYIYEQYLERYPRDPDYHNNLGAILYEKGIWNTSISSVKDALRELNEAIALNPNNPAYYSNRALALYSLIRFKEETRKLEDPIDPEKILQETLGDLRKAVELDPNNPYYRYNMGLMLYEARRFDEALNEFDKASDLDPTNPYFHYKEGMTFYKLGKYNKSLLKLWKSLELDKDARVVKYMVDLVERVKDRENLSKAKEIMSITRKFGLIDSNATREEVERMEKWLFEEVSEENPNINSIMLAACLCCPPYWFYAKTIYGPEDYVKLASNLSSITRGLLPLSEIECKEVKLPGKQEPEKYVLSFVVWGKKFTVELPFEDNWAQYGPIVQALNDLMERIGRNERYVELNTRDESTYLIFCIPENYEAYRKSVVELLQHRSFTGGC